MQTTEVSPLLAKLFSELVDGANEPGSAFMLNSGDVGLLRSLDRLSAADASQSTHDGATIAAHALHVQYGLSLMIRWATEGGNPFADATWDQAWLTTTVNAARWDEIRRALRDDAHRWLALLGTPRDVPAIGVTGMISSIAHLAYHLGAIRQIDKQARGPKDGTFAT